MSQQRRWEFDWAGPHGTFGGAVVGFVAAVSVSWLAHCSMIVRKWSDSRLAWQLALAATVLAVIAVLFHAAFRPVRGSTVVYRVICVAGAGLWVAWTLSAANWGWRWWLARAVILAAATGVAGVAAKLASDPRPGATVEDQARAVKEASDRARDALADEWVARIKRVCDIDVTVPGIKTWERKTPDGRPTGYTVEAVTGGGGLSWQTIARRRQELEADMDMAIGCDIEILQGVTRRAALLRVSTINMLAVEQPYPDDTSELTINGPLPGCVAKDGSPVSPTLRQNSMGIYGQKQSGKTNALHDVAAGVVRCVDALLWDVELAGGGLSRQWARTFLDGRTKQPAVDWMALDEREATFMTRAGRRIAYVRKEVYQDLMQSVDDDKIPCSKALPAVEIRVDEIAKIMGAPCEFPVIRENLKFIVFEARASAVNAIFGGLEATAGIIDQDTHRQLGTVAVMRSANEACYAWALGTWANGIVTADIAWPGCTAIALETGTPAIRAKWYRITPSIIERICVATDGRHPALDEPSRLAADGRHPDGTPMDDLLPGELDCYSTRWERLRKSNRIPAAKAAPSGKATQPMDPSSSIGPSAIGQPGSIADALAGLARADRDLDAAVAAAKAARHADDDTLSADWDAELLKLTGNADTEPAEQPAPRAVDPQQQDMRAVMVQLVPIDGIGFEDLWAEMCRRGFEGVRSTLRLWLKDSQQIEWRPDREGGKHGRYYRTGGA